MFKQYQETVSFILPSAMLNAFALQYYLKMGNNHKSAKKVVSRKDRAKIITCSLGWQSAFSS